MTDMKDLLSAAVGRSEPEHPDIERVLRRAAAHRRRERLIAGATAMLLTAGLAAVLFAALHHGSTVPAAGGIVGPTRVVQIPSTSMEPTLHPGDQILIDEGAYRGGMPERGDVIAFTIDDPDISPPELVWVKRVIGLPGDVVEERRGTMYVNGKAVIMPSEGGPPDHHSLGPWRVAVGQLFVVGDDLANSNDSRYALGPVPAKGVIGQVVWVLGPDERVGGLRPPPPATVSNPSPGNS